jgi:phosphoribosylformimino-5-aminoimidazole carboxamide ribotide isomerase
MTRRMRIVPAIDLIDGKCVRLKQGAFDASEVVGEDPVQVAQAFEAAGFGRLHLVDLSGARAGEPRHLDLLREISKATNLEIDFSGGLRARQQVQRALEAGAVKVVIGSAAVTEREMTTALLSDSTVGPERVILGLDLKDGLVRIKGWEEGTPLSVDDVVSWYLPCGLKWLMSTEISRDGMLGGAAIDLYEQLSAVYPQLAVIASGGVAGNDELKQLDGCGVTEVVVGKALYEKRLNLELLGDYVW